MGTLLAERRLSLNDLAKAEGISLATARRWCLIGCNGVKLESFKVGLRRYTTRPALARFITASTAVAAGAAC